MNRNIIRTLGVAAVAAGLTFAQGPAPTTPAPGPGQGQQRHWRGHMGGRLANYLNLTDAQKEQSKQIFQAAANESQPLRDQMREVRKQLAEAVKTNAPADQINQLAATVGDLTSKLTVIHTKAFAQFYNILTPDQRTKFDAGIDRFLNRGGFGRGMGAMMRGRGMNRATQQ
jgi:Spy/CpxP family protein refolding chaperone